MSGNTDILQLEPMPKTMSGGPLFGKRIVALGANGPADLAWRPRSRESKWWAPALGHPLSASGERVIIDIVQQLRGEAGARQPQGARSGLAQMLGGNVKGLEMVASSVHVLAK